MAKFKFRLQSYLNVKEKIEDQKKLEYGKALQKVEEEEAKKRLLEQQMESTINELRQLMEAGISPQDFIRHKQFITHLEKEIINQEGVIQRAKNFAESKRIELMAAVKQKKMVSTLKDKEHAEFLTEELKAEQKIVDEIVSYKYSKTKD